MLSVKRDCAIVVLLFTFHLCSPSRCSGEHWSGFTREASSKYRACVCETSPVEHHDSKQCKQHADHPMHAPPKSSAWTEGSSSAPSGCHCQLPSPFATMRTHEQTSSNASNHAVADALACIRSMCLHKQIEVNRHLHAAITTATAQQQRSLRVLVCL